LAVRLRFVNVNEAIAVRTSGESSSRGSSQQGSKGADVRESDASVFLEYAYRCEILVRIDEVLGDESRLRG